MTLTPTRRNFLAGASILALTGPALAQVKVPDRATRAEPVAARHVTLKPSPFADATAANRRYLLSLDPERLLHNFYTSAGLPAPAPVYGGWEAAGIAGHSLGHWLTACALVIADTGDREIAARLDHALSEMARIQAAHGDGYLGGTTVERGGKIVDGKIVFEEVRRGDIRTGGFDLNGGWVPVYTWHKVHAGLVDAHRLANNPRALPLLLGLSGYFGTIIEGLSDDQVQQILRAEHGGINESYADTYAITGDPRWLRLAERLRHKAVLDPLTAQQDKLAGLHANTQIPKVIGLARLHELTGNPAHATAARFFHSTVTQHHSYAIGGNSDREHFGKPGQLADAIAETTCEACNSYNMLKLTRHLYGWQPDASLFDYYERVQLNHMLAHQRPDTGMFVYFMPMAAGGRRSYSTPEESFWCCVGSGMESHAKHADSIYWQSADTLYVNLYIPSALDLPDRGWKLALDTEYPMDGRITLTVEKAPRRTSELALRIPGWSEGATLELDGKPMPLAPTQGYARLKRRWKAGERVTLSLPMALRTEAIPGDSNTLAFLSGPLVLAADLGPADRPFEGVGPALVAAGNPVQAAKPILGALHQYRVADPLGGETTLKPFYPLHDRRTAVYLKHFTPERWATARDAYVADATARAELARRTIDVFYLGEMQPERDHAFQSAKSEAFQLNGRSGRKLLTREAMRFRLAREPGATILRITYWGTDIDRVAAITADGKPLATERRAGPAVPKFVTIDYPLSATGSATTEIGFRAEKGETLVYEARTLRP
ncbi:glycoside hydrolase family 127 protein [Sphingomonas sp. IC-56]|uniref:glycoside hydrolase family 127 protein n=1 Tax=Sphingomonas sp. IC-56 TaxID=2898529 RepID=UPI001E5B16D4|nr:glycoside hydrolase family 127 protein [Sphingomonas sp. IC-56]MCD2323077.1 glycoside hydrolase family 127 protein [Sphingomonas sp. IC-56]